MNRTNSLSINFPLIMLSMLALAIAVFCVSPAQAQNPFAKSNNSWITISGTVDDVSRDNFTLNYGTGSIIVEMDDGDRDADAYKLLPGDKVTVNGKIDDDFFELTTIEASSVYVEKLGTTFSASPRDERVTLSNMIQPVVTPAVITLTGTVTQVGEEDFTLNTDLRRLTIDTEGLSFNPLDDTGFIKIGVGDVVEVTGSFDEDFFEKRKFQAETINKLVE